MRPLPPCVWESDSRTRWTLISLARLARQTAEGDIRPHRPPGHLDVPPPNPASCVAPWSALYTASFAARRTATCSRDRAGSGSTPLQRVSAGGRKTCAPLSASIAPRGDFDQVDAHSNALTVPAARRRAGADSDGRRRPRDDVRAIDHAPSSSTQCEVPNIFVGRRGTVVAYSRSPVKL